MFERYDHKARRLIYFARYQASQYGSHEITPVHLLLSLFRENVGLMHQHAHELTRHIVSSRIEKDSSSSSPSATASKIPLSAGASRVLTYAFEESRQMGDRQVAPEHLLLALGRDKDSLAAKLLEDHGFNLERSRRLVLHVGPRGPSFHFGERIPDDFRKWGVRFDWKMAHCTPRPALMNRFTHRIFLLGDEPYDAARFELVKGGWTNYRCVFCWRDLYNSEHPESSLGYTNGQEWLCFGCFLMIAPEGARDAKNVA